MFRFVAALRFKKLQRKMMKFGEITPDNWSEYKSMFIDCIRMACKADTNCSDNILDWNMLATFRQYQDKISANIPVEYLTDIFVTLSEISHKSNPEIWDMLKKIRDM